ncbi:MAG TPA: type VI secretion system domain-containing protein, partial [Gemmatimonadaceae bacterium]
TPEDLESGFGATPKAWYRTLAADLQGCLVALKALDDVCSTKFGDIAPNFARLNDALADVQRTISQQLKRKLEIDPDPVQAAETAAAEADSAGAGSPVSPQTGGSTRSLPADPVSADDAAARIVAAARYLRQQNPFNPAAYLLLRGFRWGELRANRTLDPKLLEAPATGVRTNLKGLLLDARWPQLLEACEVVMGSPHGRGWLDLQRYALTACESLGSDYDAVSAALRGALRSLLADMPQLVDMTLMDDTPTANAETRAWLRGKIRLDAGAPDSTGDTAREADDEGDRHDRDPIALANAEVRAGRADRAIALLMRESSREKTRRGRFLFQSQLARIMVDAGHAPVAMPILEELIADIEAFKLEEWEAGELVAAPMSLLYRCLEKAESGAETRQSLYLRICRLDPVQAISFGQH